MKRLRLLYLLLLFLSFAACENKRDTNGDLGGMWQLTEWSDAQGHILYDKGDTTIYYKVRNQLFMFQQLPGGVDNYYLSYFEKSGEELHFSRFYHFPGDTLVKVSSLHAYGVPSDSVLHIEQLTSSRLVLSSGDSIRLTFRKY